MITAYYIGGPMDMHKARIDANATMPPRELLAYGPVECLNNPPREGYAWCPTFAEPDRAVYRLLGECREWHHKALFLYEFSRWDRKPAERDRVVDECIAAVKKVKKAG